MRIAPLAASPNRQALPGRLTCASLPKGKFKNNTEFLLISIIHRAGAH
jgi:hypothetical protein